MAKFKLNKATIKVLENASNKALLKWWVYLQSKIQGKLRKWWYDTWDLVRSIQVKSSPSIATVWSDRPQAFVAETWRKAWTFPNLDALVWRSRRKWMIQWRATWTYDQLDSKDRWTIFVIARSIAKKWIKWDYIFSSTLEENKEEIQKIYSGTLSSIIKWTG